MGDGSRNSKAGSRPRRLTAILLAGVLTGCTVGPQYKPDQFAVPAGFTDAPHAATPEEIARTNAEMQDWWAQFHDAELNALVRAAIAGNYNLKIADQRIVAEHQMRQETASAWYPQVDAMTGGGDDRYSVNIDNWPLRPGNPANRPEASVLTYGARASWEIDVFGRIRREVEASERAIDESIEARRGVLVTMLADLAGDYMDMRATQARLEIARHNVRVAQDALSLTQRLFAHGVGNNLQVSQAQTEYDSEIARLEPLQAHFDRDAHAIAVLTGQPPGALEEALAAPSPLPVMPPFPQTLPSIVVANRPDIREAERAYAEDTARIGVAVAQLYPNFSVPLTFNPQASAAYQAFQLGGMSWQFLMLASMPLIHGGRLTAQIARARATAEASRLHYRQTVLHGFQEVEDAMSDWQHDTQLVARLDRASADATLTNQRATRLYGAGLTDFLNVLSSERTLLDVQDRLAQAHQAQLRDAVTLYTAIGAGWQGRALRDTHLPVDQSQQNILAKAFSR
jgi:NodT family efflux transporter outer membrane factor (OMF) lipoprotein